MTATDPLTVSPDIFRSVLGNLPTGVVVITTATQGGPMARAANSFTSVSLEPPLVSVCFRNASPMTPALCASGSWGVSVLAADQRDLCAHFANRGTARDLSRIPHTIGGHTGAALLTECVATLECRSVLTQEAGDHTVLIGEVLAAAVRRDHAPLLFYRGSYRTIG
jgi:flavin reductase (DIM6/NTAB) family NADH-FMN oxidoreductase RutF